MAVADPYSRAGGPARRVQSPSLQARSLWQALQDSLRSRYERLDLARHAATARLVLIALLVANLVGNLVWLISSGNHLEDLGSFLHSGAAYHYGLNPYGYYSWLRPQPISADALNLNPPISVYLFEPLASVDELIIRYVFLVGSLLLFSAAVAILLRAYPDKRSWTIVLALFSLAGLWHTLYYVQIYAPMLMAFVAAWALMKQRRRVAAGVLIGLVIAIKPNYALVPLAAFAAGHRRLAVSAIGAAAMVSAIPLIVDGPHIYREWLSMSMRFDGVDWTSNASLMAVGGRMGLPLGGKLLAGGAVAGILYALWRLRPSAPDSVALGLMATLLFGPVSWAGYTLFLLPWLLSKRWDALHWAAVLMLAIPFSLLRFVALHGGDADILIGSVYAWAILLLLYRCLTDNVQREPSVQERNLFFSRGDRPLADMAPVRSKIS